MQIILINILIFYRKIYNSFDVALKTEDLLEKLILQRQWKSARELMKLVKSRIKFIRDDLPTEATATNVMRHILKIIREEYESASKVPTGLSFI